MTIDKGTRAGPANRHGGASRRKGVVGRVVVPARGLESAAAGRSERGGRRADRTVARAGRGRRRAATIGCAWSTCPRSSDVEVGDTVVTSGIDGIYPKGFVIGRVDAVEKSGVAYRTIGDPSGGRFLGAGGRAGRADADPARERPGAEKPE